MVLTVVVMVVIASGRIHDHTIDFPNVGILSGCGHNDIHRHILDLLDGIWIRVVVVAMIVVVMPGQKLVCSFHDEIAHGVS